LIAEPLYLAHYIEKAGTGTLDMIARCQDAGLPEPDFEQRAAEFVITLRRGWLTDVVLGGMGLNERQMKAVDVARREVRLTNSRYQEITGATRPTAKRDLEDLVSKGVLIRIGAGRGTHYQMSRKRLGNGPNGS
jgi:ATP-dependent DNA helicase RecG